MRLAQPKIKAIIHTITLRGMTYAVSKNGRVEIRKTAAISRA